MIFFNMMSTNLQSLLNLVLVFSSFLVLGGGGGGDDDGKGVEIVVKGSPLKLVEGFYELKAIHRHRLYPQEC